MNTFIDIDDVEDVLLEIKNTKGIHKFYVVCDENTAQFCLPLIHAQIHSLKAKVFVIPAGEENKNIDQVQKIWNFLLENHCDRKSCLINLGGGMITDLGGFAASVFKRGIEYINIPTSLLAMVDAAFGGKTAIDFNGIKNSIGSFQHPLQVLIISKFLNTLPSEEKLSAFAEILKYGLIKDRNLWNQSKNISLKKIADWDSLISACVAIKREVVSLDPEEVGRRKILNFGHTIGHALESYSMLHHQPKLTHGEAVAHGMIMEAFISTKVSSLSLFELDEIKTVISNFFHFLDLKLFDRATLIELMLQDKKNVSAEMRFSLLTSIGNSVYDVPCSIEMVMEAFDYYESL